MWKKSNIRLCGLRHLWVLLLLCGGLPVPHVHAQAGTSSPEIREFDPDRLAKFRNDERFQYSRDTPEPPKKKPKRKKKDKQSTSGFNPPQVKLPRSVELTGLGKIALWILVISAVIFILLQILKIQFRKLFKKKSDEAEVVYMGEIEEEVDIRSMEFESLLDKAIREKRFRYAVRLLYLQSLRQMSEKGLISWRQEKTNHEYLRELRNSHLRPIFSEVTFLFEYIWYGEFPVDKDHFHSARGSFIELEQALRRTDEG